jgi:hypothetical protein
MAIGMLPCWCFLVLRRCFRDAPEVLRGGRGDAIAAAPLQYHSCCTAALLLLLGAKQDQNMYTVLSQKYLNVGHFTPKPVGFKRSQLDMYVF